MFNYINCRKGLVVSGNCKECVGYKGLRLVQTLTALGYVSVDSVYQRLQRIKLALITDISLKLL